MATEIERRFLVKGDEWKSFAKQTQDLKQGYLSTSFDEWITRVRIIDEKDSEITLKKKETSMKNIEFSYPIPINDAYSIWQSISKKIIKIRYYLNFGPGEWIVDCFQGENYPLILAEVEINSEKDFVEVPKWCVKEITGVRNLSNAYLANSPISNWQANERTIIFNL